MRAAVDFTKRLPAGARNVHNHAGTPVLVTTVIQPVEVLGQALLLAANYSPVASDKSGTVKDAKEGIIRSEC